MNKKLFVTSKNILKPSYFDRLPDHLYEQIREEILLQNPICEILLIDSIKRRRRKSFSATACINPKRTCISCDIYKTHYKIIK